MKTSLKAITNTQRWRLAAITLGSALAMTIAIPAFAAGPKPNVNSPPTASGIVGLPFSYQITATNPPLTGYGSTVPAIPGVSFSATTGLFSGTPTTTGTFSGNITATNANGTSNPQALTITINPPPTPTPPPHTDPTAVASISPLSVYADDTVTLDSTGSQTNPPGGALTYAWQQPPGQSISLSHQGDPIATFLAPAPPVGQDSRVVTFTLKVKDDDFPSLNDTSDPVTTTVYALPTANAGPDQSVDQGTTVMLSGSGSTGVSLTYAWTAPAGITLSDATVANPTFTAPAFTAPDGASYTFTLKVTEHRAGFPPKESVGDQVVIMVKQPPIAYASFVNDINNITPQGTVSESSCTTLTNVTLYGFASDPDGDPLGFNWTQVHDTGGTALQPGDITVGLSDNAFMTPTFTAPDLPNGIQQVDLVFQLTVNDGTINSAPSYVTIHVQNTNDPPIAVASAAPSTVPEGGTVTLDGSGSSDPNQDQDTLTYTWTQIGSPVVTLSDVHAVMPTFTAPAVATTLSFLLTVTDTSGCSDQKPVDVTVVENNHPPVADAGTDKMVPELSNTCLDGSGSYDPDGVGDHITYAWTQVHDAAGTMLQPGDTTVNLVNPSTSQPCFDTPDVGPGGVDLYFQLIVTDSHNASSGDIALVHVNYVNHPPTAHAGDDQLININEGDIVHLSGSADDLDGNTPLTYTWTQVSGPQVTLSDPTDRNATFTAPAVDCGGDVVKMRFDVDDGYGDVAPDGVSDEVIIKVANVNHNPTANGGGNQNAHTGQVVTLHGSGGDQDPGEVGSLMYHWEQVSNGAPTVTLYPANPSGSAVTFTAPNVGGSSVSLEFKLTVTDVCYGSGTDLATITVANPIAVAQGPATVNENTGAMLNGSGSYDPDGDPVTYKWTQVDGPTVTLDEATSGTPSFTAPWISADTQVKFQLVVKDPGGFSSAPAYVTFTIINSHTPPDITAAHVDVGVLWPPDHKMALVHIIGVIKPSDDKIAITGVTQDEPTNGLGDGDTAIDAVKQVNASGDDSVLLRAERSGNGNGRVYHVCFHIEDPEQDADGCVNVSVPKSKKTDVAVDSGQNYDSTH